MKDLRIEARPVTVMSVSLSGFNYDDPLLDDLVDTINRWAMTKGLHHPAITTQTHQVRGQQES